MSHPRGKIYDDDKGEVRMAIAVDHVREVIHCDFGKEVRWFALDLESARQWHSLIGTKIQELAAAVEKHKRG